MPRPRYFFYDHEACTFVEARPSRRRLAAQAVGFTFVTLALTTVLTFAIDRMGETPEEASLRQESRALQHQLAVARVRMARFEQRLDTLAERDERLYRTLLEAPGISPETRRVGVGGADAYAHTDAFSRTTAATLRLSGETLDRIERQTRLQDASYRELMRLAAARNTRLAEMPALLPAAGPIVSGFGMRRHPVLGVRHAHAGVDIVLPTGSAVYSTAAGVVKSVQRSATYGNVIEVAHPASGYTTLYAHLSRALVRAGQEVRRGEKIALSGNTGRSTGPHLHYEVREGHGQPLDPAMFFAMYLTPTQYRNLVAQNADPDAAPATLD
jgi:murein DD-endopeptidase MepM/ murein hydrolase activator NlpD